MQFRLAASQPAATYYSVKRFIGQQLKTTKDLAASVRNIDHVLSPSSFSSE